MLALLKAIATRDAAIGQFSGLIKRAFAIHISTEVIVCSSPLSKYLVGIDGIEIRICSPSEDNYRHAAFGLFSQANAHRLEGEKPLMIWLRATHRYCTETRNCGRARCKLEAREHTNRHEEIRVGSSQNNRHRCPRRKTCHINPIRIDIM
jgi:hypothetical protein